MHVYYLQVHDQITATLHTMHTVTILQLYHSGTDYISGSPFGSNYQLPIVGLSCGAGAANISECQTYTQTSTYCNHRTNMGVICGKPCM